MKFIIILFISVLIMAGCQTSEEKAKWENLKTQQPKDDENLQNAINNIQTENDSKFWEPLVWKNVLDNKGVVILSQPIPANWKYSNTSDPNSPIITGPNNLKIYMLPFKSFLYYNDQFMMQAAQQSGMNLRRMPSTEEIMQVDIIPMMAKKGLTFVKKFDLPNVAKVDKWYKQQLYKVAPTREIAMSIGSEWKSENGDPCFVIINIGSSEDQTSQFWNYNGYLLQSDPQYYERSKKQLTFTLENTQYNLEPIREYNQSEARKAGISWAAHNQRMAANQANFQAQQRAHVNSSEAVNDAIMAGWRSNNAASDKNQEQFIDVINEQTNVVDHSTGKEYKVQSHYNKYWMNSNGEYISTNQNTYDPNADVNMNRQKWEELHKND